jgi:hypothetical protein
MAQGEEPRDYFNFAADLVRNAAAAQKEIDEMGFGKPWTGLENCFLSFLQHEPNIGMLQSPGTLKDYAHSQTEFTSKEWYEKIHGIFPEHLVLFFYQLFTWAIEKANWPAIYNRLQESSTQRGRVNPQK